VAQSGRRAELHLDDRFLVFVPWLPKQRLRGHMRLRIYDADNRVAVDSKPAKSDFRKEQLLLSSWSIPMLSGVGTYRADVLLDDTPMWRGFVRITP
jgi:hypothetical protein